MRAMKARKTDSIFIRCEPAFKKRLQAAAREQHRTVPEVVILAVLELLQRMRGEKAA